MGLLGNNNCIGIFLGINGVCRAVKMEGSRKEFEIQAVAECTLEGEDNAEQIKELVDSLNPSDNSLVIAGSDRLGNTVDLIMPKLSPEDLQSALQFEIPKYTPLSDEDVIWGYRIVGDIGEKGQHLRLGITPATEWEHTISLLGSVSTGVEMIMPPPMALDPAFGDVDYCCFDDGCNRSMLTKNDEGLRDAAFVEVDALTNPFQLPATVGINPECSAEVDENLCKASLLAVYGLTANLRKDRRTWVKVPQTIQTKRRRSLMVVNAILALVLLGAGIYTGVSYLVAYNKEVGVYSKHVDRLKKEIEAISVVKADDKLITQLEKEMDDVLRDRPGFANLLSIITEIIDDSHWSDRFSWNGERFTIGLKTTKDDSDVAMLLEQSGYFENVTFKKDTSTSGQVALTVEMQVKEKHRENAAAGKGGAK